MQVHDSTSYTGKAKRPNVKKKLKVVENSLPYVTIGVSFETQNLTQLWEHVTDEGLPHFGLFIITRSSRIVNVESFSLPFWSLEKVFAIWMEVTTCQFPVKTAIQTSFISKERNYSSKLQIFIIFLMVFASFWLSFGEVVNFCGLVIFLDKMTFPDSVNALKVRTLIKKRSIFQTKLFSQSVSVFENCLLL